MIHQNLRLLFGFFTIIAFSTLFSSCVGKTPPATFYLLNSMQGLQSINKLPQDVAIAIGPVHIPSELDRSQIITRDIGNRISFSEFNRWAGPLQDNIASVLSVNLTDLLGTERIAPRTRNNIFPFTHYIIVSINRFDGQLKGEVVLDMTWSIKAKDSPEPLIVKRSIIQEIVLSPDYNEIVVAKSKALAKISREIADSFKELINKE